MWEGDIHILVCHTWLRIRTMCRGKPWCRHAIHHTQFHWTCGRTWLFPRTVVARSYRRCCLVCGIHGTRRKKFSAKLHYSIPKGCINLCYALSLGWMASCRGPSVSDDAWISSSVCTSSIVINSYLIDGHCLCLSLVRIGGECGGRLPVSSTRNI
jgi:hypothetical protein